MWSTNTIPFLWQSQDPPCTAIQYGALEDLFWYPRRRLPVTPRHQGPPSHSQPGPAPTAISLAPSCFTVRLPLLHIRPSAVSDFLTVPGLVLARKGERNSSDALVALQYPVIWPVTHWYVRRMPVLMLRLYSSRDLRSSARIHQATRTRSTTGGIAEGPLLPHFLGGGWLCL